jgi:hypothetical protein
MYSRHRQYLDMTSGFHVIELRDAQGNQHVIQLAVGHASCPTCGAVHPKANLDELDPEAVVAEVTKQLNASQQQMLAYAAKHGLKVK